MSHHPESTYIQGYIWTLSGDTQVTVGLSWSRPAEWCKGTEGNRTYNIRYWAGPSGKQTPPQAAPHFLSSASSVSHWLLTCHADNYLLNTAGSDSVCVYVLVFCQLPYSQHSLLKGGVISLPTWLGPLDCAHMIIMHAHKHRHTHTLPRSIITMCQALFDSYYKSNSMINNTNFLPLFLSHYSFSSFFKWKLRVK